MGGEFKPTSISLDALSVRQLAEIDDAFLSNDRSFFQGRSDQIRKIVGWFHGFIFSGRSLEEFVRAMQSISVVNAYQVSLSSAAKDGACASATPKPGPQRVSLPSVRSGQIAKFTAVGKALGTSFPLFARVA